MEYFNLSGKVAILTGGNRGIGFSIAKGMARAGADVIIANRKAAEGQNAADAIKKEGLKAAAVPVDVTSIPSIHDMVSKSNQRFWENRYFGQ